MAYGDGVTLCYRCDTRRGACTGRCRSCDPRGPRSRNRQPAGDMPAPSGTDADDHLIGMARGIIRTRDVRRLETSKRHKLEVLTEMLGVPWSFTASGVPRLMAPRTPATIALPAPMTPMPPGFALGTAAPGTPAGSFVAPAPATPIAAHLAAEAEGVGPQGMGVIPPAGADDA